MAAYKFIRGGGNEPTRSGLCNETCRHAMTKKFTAGYSNLRPHEILGLCGTTLPKLNAAYDMLNIGVNSYWAQGLKPPHFYDHGARLYDEPPHFCDVILS